MWSENNELEAKAVELPNRERSKFLELPYYLHLWTKDYGGLKGKKVLDFGCGEGTSAAGIALLHGAMVHGVDINSEAKQCASFLKDHLGIEPPEHLTFQEITPGGAIDCDGFDCIFSWSVFEHVSNRLYADVLADLFSRLKPGGLFFMQISPLYFSPEGSHLWSIGYGKWEHLICQHSEVIEDITKSGLEEATVESLIAMFDTLNRVTAEDVLERFTMAGFELLGKQIDQIDFEPPEALLRAYTRDALTTFQIVALFRRPA